MTESIDREKSYYYSFNVLRLILPLFVCMNSFGVSALNTGSRFVQAICGFAGITFFILSGFLVLGKEDELEEKLGRALKRTAVMFGVVLAVYVIFNVIFYCITKTNVCPAWKNESTWFDFIVLNRWPLMIGENFWFIHCLLYGYIAVFILNKLKLLKYDWLIFAVCMVIALLTGEFAGLIGFNVFDYTCIPATVITRSLPYLMLGRILYRYKDKIKKKKPGIFVAMLLAGVVLAVAEYGLLVSLDKFVYSGHFIGNGVIAASLVMLFARNRKLLRHVDLDFSNTFAKAVYILHQPVGFLIIALCTASNIELIRFVIPALPFVLFVVIFIICLLTNKIKSAKMSSK